MDKLNLDMDPMSKCSKPKHFLMKKEELLSLTPQKIQQLSFGPDVLVCFPLIVLFKQKPSSKERTLVFRHSFYRWEIKIWICYQESNLVTLVLKLDFWKLIMDTWRLTMFKYREKICYQDMFKLSKTVKSLDWKINRR